MCIRDSILPINIDNIDNLGELSFLVKQTNISFKRNAGENNNKVIKYFFVIAKTVWSAPKKVVIVLEKNIAEIINKQENIKDIKTVVVNILLALFDFPWLLKIVYLVAPPIPNINPTPRIKL